MKSKTIFLDRDGVINDNSANYYIYKIKDFVINKGIFECLEIFFQKGYQIIIITNQGGIAKQQYSKHDVEKLNEHIKSEFSKKKIHITDIYYCPHHSTVSKCLCRKPNSLMLEKAVAQYNIDITNSFMIGDSDTDIEAAQKIGIKGIKIDSNSNLFESLNNSNYAYLLK